MKWQRKPLHVKTRDPPFVGPIVLSEMVMVYRMRAATKVQGAQ